MNVSNMKDNEQDIQKKLIPEKIGKIQTIEV
jgi:hypothetical protein